ncbi:MAG: hypothetical protein II306_06950, partial [Clostridia bacterium]|nr:hypothetical protein [Clostridia bacterium]
TLTAHNTRRDFFEYISLDSLIECTYDADTDYIYEMDYMRDLRNAQVYKVMSDNGTYALCTVEVVPEGGEWADEQESVDNPYKMTVTVGSSVSGFTDLGEGWAYATSQTLPTTVTMFDDWFAPGGKFEYSSGTNKGRLYVNNKDITIDLNGNTISRNLEEATSDGQVFRIAGSSKLTIVDNSATGNGKITGGNNNGNGGAFYIDSGSLHINGGEISGNYATNGAAVYWCSGGNLCITGGVITNNLAKDNGGAVYITNNGKVYFGGTAVIKNSSRGNVYISDKDANIYHAKGQADGVPDMPLTEGACIGIYASDSDDTISGDNSRFGEDDHKYFFSDSTDHYIRAVYKEGDGNHAYKLYINALTNSETKFPAIESVAVINSELLQSATVNNDTKVITLTGYANKKSSFEQVTLASLISYTFNSDATSVSGSNALYNLSTPTDYKVMSDNGTYTVYTVVVEWFCSEHADEDNNNICDYCGEYITATPAINYDEETFTVTATGDGAVILYVNGVVVERPHTFEQGNT